MVRLRAKWHRRSKVRSAEDNGSVLASVSYKTAREVMQRLLGADFDLTSNERRFAIFAELLAFQVQFADRLAHDRVDEINRRKLIVSFGKHLARLIDENMLEMIGPSSIDYRSQFIKHLNERLNDYAEFGFDGQRPSYSAMRYLGGMLCDLADRIDRRWLMEQTVDIEAPFAVDTLLRGWRMLYGKQGDPNEQIAEARAAAEAEKLAQGATGTQGETQPADGPEERGEEAIDKIRRIMG